MLLILPGFFTDALGLLLLVPPVRGLLIRWGASRATVRAASYVRRRGRGGAGRPETIEADYEVVETRPGARGEARDGSGWTRPH